MELKHLSVATFAVASFVGCASWWSNTPSHVIDVAKIVTCVMTEIDKVPTPPIQDIAVKCGLENADAVLDLVKAQKAAEARHAKPAGSSPPPCLSASATAPTAAPTATSTATSAAVGSAQPAKPATSGSAKP